ncbi:MAG: hypothetical protein LQ349_004412 [Xanthoria aureola]|nr:MAG: hypothetical protein LQ349_004412 [Xanthoria aureola]
MTSSIKTSEDPAIRGIIFSLCPQLRREVNPARKRPEDVLPGFCNAEDSEKHLSSLTHFFDEDMDITHDLAGTTLHRFEQTSGELEGLKREIRRASSTADVVPTIIKRMTTTFPLQANQVLEEQSLEWEHRASTQAALDALTSRVDSFYAHMQFAWKEVHRRIIQELGIRDYKKIFDQSVKKARAAAESAKESCRSMKLEVRDMQTKLIAKELKLQDVNSALHNVKQELTVERGNVTTLESRLKATKRAVEGERGNVTKKNERIAILTAQLQGARSVAKDERATVARQDEQIATLTAQLEETRTAVDNEHATVAKQDEQMKALISQVETVTAQLRVTRIAIEDERGTVSKKDE